MIALILFFLVGICKAISDTVADHYYSSVFSKFKASFWNKNVSWINKYKHGKVGMEPRFFGSTTFLVWITDAWHLFNALGHILTFIAVLLLPKNNNFVIYASIGFYIMLPLGFNLGYNLFKKSIWITKK